MEIGFNEGINKLEKLDKIELAIKEAIRLFQRYKSSNENINIPIKILSNELENIRLRTEQFKNNAVKHKV